MTIMTSVRVADIDPGGFYRKPGGVFVYLRLRDESLCALGIAAGVYGVAHNGMLSREEPDHLVLRADWRDFVGNGRSAGWAEPIDAASAALAAVQEAQPDTFVQALPLEPPTLSPEQKRVVRLMQEREWRLGRAGFGYNDWLDAERDERVKDPVGAADREPSASTVEALEKRGVLLRTAFRSGSVSARAVWVLTALGKSLDVGAKRTA